MPRPHRFELPGIPQHVIQRGNNRAACFGDQSDYRFYLAELGRLVQREACDLHAYVLMTNHVHLLVTPREKGAIACVMQSLGRCYVRQFNDRHARTGTLWEGRYKACLVEEGNHLLHCYRYIESNPVRASIVADPADYPWSSHRHNAFGEPDAMVTPHRTLLALGQDADERQRAFRNWTMASVDSDELDAIRGHVQRQHAYGSEAFRAAIKSLPGRPAAPQKIGRPMVSLPR
jgi:putative transposase